MNNKPEDKEIFCNIDFVKGYIDSGEDPNSLYRIEKSNYYYDYIKDLKTCNDDFIKGGSNNSSFDDYSYEENSPQIEIKRKLIDEKKEINVNLFNKNFQK